MSADSLAAVTSPVVEVVFCVESAVPLTDIDLPPAIRRATRDRCGDEPRVRGTRDRSGDEPVVRGTRDRCGDDHGTRDRCGDDPVVQRPRRGDGLGHGVSTLPNTELLPIAGLSDGIWSSVSQRL